MTRSEAGFTLIELMTTVTVITILAAVAYPAYTDQIRKGKRIECRSSLFQSMQEQERNFIQLNHYTAFKTGDPTALTNAFSGDSLAASSCSLAAVQCVNETTGTAPLAQCIEIQASMRSKDDPVRMMYLSSNGDKGCTFGSAERVTAEKQCWP